jgi:hypothetical protein
MFRSLALLVPLLFTSCFFVETVDLNQHLLNSELYLTEDPAPEGAMPLSSIAIKQAGWYFFGIWPVEEISLEVCMQAMVEKALEMGAEGVAEIKVEYNPASTMRFSTFIIPDWSATINLTGMAFRMSDPVSAFWKPNPPAGPLKRR